jgi:hypothetical protein
MINQTNLHAKLNHYLMINQTNLHAKLNHSSFQTKINIQSLCGFIINPISIQVIMLITQVIVYLVSFIPRLSKINQDGSPHLVDNQFKLFVVSYLKLIILVKYIISNMNLAYNMIMNSIRPISLESIMCPMIQYLESYGLLQYIGLLLVLRDAGFLISEVYLQPLKVIGHKLCDIKGLTYNQFLKLDKIVNENKFNTFLNLIILIPLSLRHILGFIIMLMQSLYFFYIVIISFVVFKLIYKNVFHFIITSINIRDESLNNIELNLNVKDHVNKYELKNFLTNEFIFSDRVFMLWFVVFLTYSSMCGIQNMWLLETYGQSFNYLMEERPSINDWSVNWFEIVVKLI